MHIKGQSTGGRGGDTRTEPLTGSTERDREALGEKCAMSSVPVNARPLGLCGVDTPLGVRFSVPCADTQRSGEEMRPQLQHP